MNALPKTPGPHKINFIKHASELFEIEKEGMATSKHLYQFKSFGEFLKCFTVDHQCEVYIWNNKNQETIGFFIHETFEEKNIDELIVIVVRPKFQNQGYGKKIMRFYLGLLKNKGVLSTHEENTDAIRFYLSLGYKIIKTLPNHYHDGQTRILLEKEI